MLTPAQIAFWMTALVVTGLCIWRGERTQKIAAATVLAAFLASEPVHPLVWNGLRWGVALVDLALAALLFAQSVNGRRWWLHAASAFAWVNAFVHLAAMFDLEIWWMAYVASRWLFSALVLAAPAAGFIEAPHAQRYLAWEARRTSDGHTHL